MATTANINVNLNTTGNAEKNIGEVVNATKSLRTQLQEMRNELNNLDEGSQRFKQLSIEAGKLEDQIKDTKDIINATAGTAVENLGTALNKTASVGIAGFQAVMSAQALFGDESKALTETLVKLQAVAGLADAVNTLGGLGDTLTQIKASALAAAQGMGLMTVATEAEAVATEGATVATNGLSTAMKALPIIAIAAGIAALVYALVQYNKQNSETEKIEKKRAQEQKRFLEEKKRLNEETKKGREFVAQESSAFVGLINQLRATNAGSKERKDLIKEINKDYGTTLKNLQDEKKFQIQLNAVVNDYLNFQRAKYALSNLNKEQQRLIAREEELNSQLASSIFDIGDAQRLANTGDASAIKILEEKNKKYEVQQNTLKFVQNRLKELGVEELKLREQTKDKYIPTVVDSTKTNEKNTQSLKDANDAINDVVDGMNKLSDAQFKLGEYNFGKNLEDGLKNQQKLIQETGQYDVEYITNLINNQKKVEDQYIISQQNIKKSNAKTQDEIQAIDTETYLLLEQNEDKYKDLKTKSYSDLEKAQEDYANQVVETDKDLLSKQKMSWSDYTQSISKSWKENWQNTLSGLVDLAANIIGSVTDSLGNIFEMQAQKATYERESRYNKELENYQLLLDQQLISREEYDTKIELLNQQKEQQERAARGKAFKQQKALNLVNAVMAGAQAVVQGLATQPFIPLGIAMGALAGVLTATQIGVISSQQFTAAKGGIVPGNGPGNIDSVPSLLAPGEAVINSNSTAMFGDLLSAINEMGGGVSLVPNTPFGGTSMVKNSVFAENDRTPIRAYVVESEMTDRQRRVSRIERTASFG